MIEENILLAPYTTFKIGGVARYFSVVQNLDELKQALEFGELQHQPIFILEGGSNILISDQGFPGLVIKIEFSGREVINQDSDNVWLKIASGEVWDEVVDFAVQHNWWGVENLSHIPGRSGAIAVQNVGAYGQEASQVIEELGVYDTSDQKAKSLKAKDCQFGYRSSIFNGREKGRYVILYLILKLDKSPAPELSYGDLKRLFEGKLPKIVDIRQAVIDIRDKKFPFPTKAKNGNAGSFFKNPVLSLSDYQSLLAKVTESLGPERAAELERKKNILGQSVKLPAAFLLEICGLKNLSVGGATINKNQPLVIVNKTGKAKASEVLELAGLVREQVLKQTGIKLNFEPELVGFGDLELK